MLETIAPTKKAIKKLLIQIIKASNIFLSLNNIINEATQGTNKVITTSATTVCGAERIP